ncbi:lipopolysaccharide assembly protein LapB [Uliginosibacterium aquaticum]|uniref:Lipopolysaccharide assembly protein B n=1 Tax=Uliginosibacterium aquaticum TaxID=2731212 RepID=A0ABX2IDT9_9RHOO|nr:lipopolysaccharide assembly protein LapB [Uliginosibacterium aquaticum]NSL54663.1 lipopolysaccharide assembly protein LapB [Uliginosibacterium aquaticum]
MDFELWWLLSWPLFFGAGWLAARIDIRHLVNESRALPRSTLSGLNFLLNEQPDKAIDSFLEAVQLDPQTVELHFALGNLFRKRGELDRAIRIHQSLVDREVISEEHREQALQELGEDYLKAGLLDRAEAVYLQLRSTSRNEVANDSLLQIYQQEKNWQRAIDIARDMPRRGSHRWEVDIANFYCEIAATAMARSDFEAARVQLRLALESNRKCVRANLLLGEVLSAQGDDVSAVEAWQEIAHQDPMYLSLIAERLMDAHRRLGHEEKGAQFLKTHLGQTPSLDLLETVFKWEIERKGVDAAYTLVRDEIKRNPTLLGLEKLLEAAEHTIAPERKGDLDMVKSLIHSHTRRVARYCCKDCGFKARQFYWRCPACGGWETYPPKRTEEFDLAI